MIGNQIIGPSELPARLHGQNYIDFLQNTLPGLLNQVLAPEQQEEIIYMHDGAPAHYMGEVRNYLNEVYPDRRIGREGPTARPPRSPDFNPLDYFFGGYSKECVYHNGALANIYEIRDRIRDHARNVPQEMV